MKTTRTLALVVVAVAGLGAAPSSAQDTQLLEAYRYLDEARELDERQRQKQQFALLNATLETTSTSLAVMDKTTLYVERLAATGMLIAPDGRFATELQDLSDHLSASTKRLAQTWPMKGVGSVLAVKGYKDRLDEADAELRSFLDDPNLPPEAGQALAALRGIGAALEGLGDVPVVGMAIGQYGEIVKSFSYSFRQNYRTLAPGGRDGALLNSYSTDLRRGFPGDLPTETQVLLATRWEVPLVRDGHGDDHYLKVGDRWEKVDGAHISSIVSDWLIVHRRPEEPLLQRGFALLGDAVDRARGDMSKAPDRSYPTPDELLALAGDSRESVFGLGFSRRRLRSMAEERLALMADLRAMKDALGGVAAFEEEQVEIEQYRAARTWLRRTTGALGIPLSPQREANLVRDLFVNAELVPSALRTVALSLHPGSEDYVRGLERDPRTVDLAELADLLRELRDGTAFVRVRVRVRGAEGNGPVPGAAVTLARALGPEGGTQPGPLGVREVTVDADGRAEVEVLRGYHRLSAVAEGFESQIPDRPAPFVAPGSHGATLTLARHFVLEELRGTLVALVRERGDGEPIPGARVELRRGNETLTAAAGTDGAARIDDIPYGTWTLSASAEGFRAASWDDFEVGPDDPDRRGTIRLGRLDPEVRPASLPRPPAAPRAPKIDPGQCGYQPLGEWKGASAEGVHPGAKEADDVAGGAAYQLEAPGPGRLRVTVGISGGHEVSNHEYGSQRFRARVKLRSDPSVMGTGWVAGGEFYPGVRDYGENSYSWKVKGPGPVSMQFVPEACWIRKYEGQIRCWVLGSTQLPGIKLLPVSYTIRAEFDPCQ